MSRYIASDDDEVIASGRPARARGHYPRDEFIRACRWKTPRSTPLVARHTESAVREATRTALAGSTPERGRMMALRSLHGVEWPTASVLLHLAYPERYPILDQRALQALGRRRAPAYGLAFWEAYVGAWLELVGQAGVDGRTFDRALWQWSKERGDPLH